MSGWFTRSWKANLKWNKCLILSHSLDNKKRKEVVVIQFFFDVTNSDQDSSERTDRRGSAQIQMRKLVRELTETHFHSSPYQPITIGLKTRLRPEGVQANRSAHTHVWQQILYHRRRSAAPHGQHRAGEKNCKSSKGSKGERTSRDEVRVNRGITLSCRKKPEG